jgi:amino acid transporter
MRVRAGIPTRYRTALRPLSLTAIIFFTVSGGPYGLEPLLNNVAPGLALALIILMPLLWSVPVMLMVLELTSMMPEEGGYYRWVQEALGRRWGFYEGWWSWLYTMVDLAIYPVLFVQYLTYFLPRSARGRFPSAWGSSGPVPSSISWAS